MDGNETDFVKFEHGTELGLDAVRKELIEIAMKIPPHPTDEDFAFMVRTSGDIDYSIRAILDLAKKFDKAIYRGDLYYCLCELLTATYSLGAKRGAAVPQKLAAISIQQRRGLASGEARRAKQARWQAYCAERFNVLMATNEKRKADDIVDAIRGKWDLGDVPTPSHDTMAPFIRSLLKNYSSAEAD